MSEYLTEKEQLDQMRQWWRENGRFIVSGIVLGVAVLLGLNYWKTHTRTQAEQAGALHQQLLEAVLVGDREAAVTASDSLTSDFASTAYAAQAPLALAKLHMEAGDPEAAVGELERALDADGEIGLIARLRLARVRLSIGDAQEALDILDGRPAGSFEPLFDDVRGDAFVELGDKTAARDAYQRALDGGPSGLDRAFVRIKLESLGLADSDA